MQDIFNACNALIVSLGLDD